MFYDVSQLSNLTNVSKVTIYSKLKLNALKPHIIKKQGKSFVDEEGLKLIKESLNIKDTLNKDLNQPLNDKNTIRGIALDIELNDLKSLNREFINTLKSEVQFLRTEIQNKNKQLDNKDKLLENMQILLKQQEDKILLEEHFKEIDRKLIDLRSELKVKSTKEKGLFSYLIH